MVAPASPQEGTCPVSDQPRILLHVGAPKCGSSSLQAALSRRPVFTDAAGRTYEYVVVQKNGTVLRSATILKRVEVSPLGSLSTRNLPRVDDVLETLGPAVPVLKDMIAEGITPILSQEGWARLGDVFGEAGIIDRLGGGARVIMFVRPPVDWLNSAWWQWGVWTRTTVDAHVGRTLRQVRWQALARAWRQVPGVERVDLGLATSDVTARFFQLLDAPAPPPVTTNAGVPGSFLLFLLRNRKYRPDAHTPKVEFVVARHLPAQRYPTPWVLSPTHIAHVFDKTAGDAAKISRLLAPEDRPALAAEPRWHSAEAYAGRRVDDLAQFETPEALARLIGQLHAGLGAADDTDAVAKRLAAAADPVAAADPMIAAAVDKMMTPHRGLGGKARRLLNRIKG